jgi:plastocyanin
MSCLDMLMKEDLLNSFSPSRIQPVIRLIPARLLLLMLAATMVLTWSFGAANAAAAATIQVGIGVGTGTVTGNVFAPGEFTINTGDSVTWTVESDEVHTLTFGNGPAGAPPPTWPSTFTAGPPNLGSADYSGTGFINTAIIPKGTTATVHFTSPGDVEFYCVLHQGMKGKVHVVAPPAAPDTQATLDQKAAATQSQILSQVDALKTQGQAAATSQTRPDGSTLWTVPTQALTQPGPMPGGGEGYLELTRYFPDNLQIKSGDSVVWQAAAPHTVTFLAPGQTTTALEQQYGGPLGVPPAKPSENYDSTQLYHSGVLALGPPGSPTSYQLTFASAGTFNYLCLLHDDLGMKGTISVSAASPTATAAGPTATAGSLPKTGGPPAGGDDPGWLMLSAIGLAIALATLVAAGIVRRKQAGAG